MDNRLTRNLTFALAALALFISGCAGTVRNMQEVSAAAPAVVPEPGKAVLVFMRPSGIGFGVQSSVFAINDNYPAVVGIVAAKTKVAYRVNPGKHLFMAVGESAEFLSAEILPDRTYFVRVEPRMGMWKARFALEPIRQKDLGSAAFAAELSDCKWVEKTAATDAWASGNIASVQSKRAEYYPGWIKQAEADRPHLRPEDGK